MADQYRLSKIYGDVDSTEPTGAKSFFGRDGTPFMFRSLRQADTGHVNRAYTTADDDIDDEDDDDGNESDSNRENRFSSSLEDVEISEREGQGDTLERKTETKVQIPWEEKEFKADEKTTIPNGRHISADPTLPPPYPKTDFKVDFEAVTPATRPPPAEPRKRQSKNWDIFTSHSKDNVSQQNTDFWNKIFVLTKLVFVFVLFCIVLGTSVVNKLCLIIVTANIFPPTQQHNTSLKTANFTLTYDTKTTDVMWIWALIMMMAAPYVFNTLSSLWRVASASAGNQLKPAVLIKVLVIETLHSIGLNVTVFLVVPSLDPISGLFFILTIAVVPGLLRFFYPRSSKEQTMFGVCLARLVSVAAFCGQVGSLFLWCYHIYQSDTEIFDEKGFLAILVAGPILISAVWWENFIKQGDKRSTGLPGLVRSVRSIRTKLSLVVNVWKLVLTVGLPMVIFGPWCETGSDCVQTLLFKRRSSDAAVLDFPALGKFARLEDGRDFGKCSSYLPLVVAAIAVLSSAICYKACKSACKIMTQIADCSLPLALSTPVTVGIVLGMYSGFITTETSGCHIPFPKWPSKDASEFFGLFTEEWWIPACAGLAAYLSFLLATNYVWSPGTDRLQTTRRLFILPLYCGVMTDQSILLNRRRAENEKRISETKRTRELPLPEEIRAKDITSAASPFRTEDTPMIYMCATMWHETDNEMIQLLKSIFRMDEDQCTRKNTQFLLNRRDPDYYEFEAHIFFDDAFEKHLDDQYEFRVNNFVKQLMKTVKQSAKDVHGNNYSMAPPTKIPTPYGGRLVWTLRGGNQLVAHLKDKAVIRHRKRWSQVMYMYYLLAYKLYQSNETVSPRKLKRKADNTYLLALDGDVDFQPRAVQLLVDRMRKNKDVGAACGRIHPIGNGAMVWYQKFEYAVSHWLQKAAEDKFGCVLCSPGCFSLFRASSLMDENVMQRYTTPPSQPRHYVQYDQGEDRWLCTLLLQQGHRVEYCAASDALTFAPEGFNEFFNQRRRWTPSTMANVLDLLSDWRNVIRLNPDITLTYIMYQAFLMLSSILTPGTIFLMIMGAINMAYPSIDLWWSMFLNLVPLAIFIILCFTTKTNVQLTYAAILSVAYSLVMMIVIVGLLRQVADFGLCSITSAFLLFVSGVFVISALVHPQEFWCIFHGFLYFLSIPAMSMVLMFYSLCNLHVVSWGTRENQQPTVTTKQQKPERSGVRGWLDQIGNKSFFENLCRCCCPTAGNLDVVLDKLDEIEAKVVELSTRGSITQPSTRAPSERGSHAVPQRFSAQKFSENPDSFEMNVDRVNPMFKDESQRKRNPLVDPFWAEDEDLRDSKMKMLKREEGVFFQELIEEYLQPLDEGKAHKQTMETQLKELRNKVCLIFVLINSLFIIVVFSLQKVTADSHERGTHSLSLKLPCAEDNSIAQAIEPISVAFTLVFGILLLIQFVGMGQHRLATLLHVCASTEIFARKYSPTNSGDSASGKEASAPKDITFQEGYDLVREMQNPKDDDSTSMISESSLAESVEDIDDMVQEAEERRRTAKLRWKKMSRVYRKRDGIKGSHTLNANFLENFKELSEKTPEGDISEFEETSHGHKHTFRSARNRQTVRKLYQDKGLTENLQKRTQQLNKTMWKIGKEKAILQNARDSTDGVRTKKMSDIVNLQMLKKQQDDLQTEVLEEDVPVCVSLQNTPQLGARGLSLVPASQDQDSPRTVTPVSGTPAMGTPRTGTPEPGTSGNNEAPRFENSDSRAIRPGSPRHVTGSTVATEAQVHNGDDSELSVNGLNAQEPDVYF